ncbi:MAG: dTDP-4-dehydrorhamnose reductase, partial [Thermodesulfovibrio sp.]|nr:dTDP-4-dehydrorhamnose reductase [Thermodesulfovibrio sp.]
MKYLITGAKGQLAREFVKFLESKGKDFLALSKDELDIGDFSQVLAILKQIKPQVVINCSAYNHVDKAEDEFEQALRVNCIGVSNLAVACREVGALLVHYSTDYVFDGQKQGLYNEEDKPNPLSKYALSKYLGERQIPSILEKYLIFRTSWVYGEGKQNFLSKLEQWAQSQDYLRVACDEFSVPTSTKTLVEVTMKTLKEGLTGLYHLVNSGYCSRYEWAKEYLRLKGVYKFIYPAYQAEFSLPAKRPR